MEAKARHGRPFMLAIILQDYLRFLRLNLVLNTFGWLLRAVKNKIQPKLELL